MDEKPTRTKPLARRQSLYAHDSFRVRDYTAADAVGPRAQALPHSSQ